MLRLIFPGDTFPEGGGPGIAETLRAVAALVVVDRGSAWGDRTFGVPILRLSRLGRAEEAWLCT